MINFVKRIIIRTLPTQARIQIKRTLTSVPFIYRIVRETGPILDIPSSYEPFVRNVNNSLFARFFSKGKVKKIITTFDSPNYNRGLADKLRGCLSTFIFCQEHGIDFAINWCYPFDLNQFLVPNNYDWTPNEKDLAKRSSVATPMVIDCEFPNFNHRNTHRMLFEKFVMRSPTPIVHLYTNTIYHNKEFHTAFHSLFKPSKKLSENIDSILNDRGKRPYVSASFRFLQLLGDFKEPSPTPILDNEKREALIKKCLHELRLFIEQTPKEYDILICSDSTTFLRLALDLPRTWAIPGEIRHASQSTSDDPALMKTFLDLLIISKAHEATQFITGQMYPSGFARFAARMGAINYTVHRF